MANVEDRVVSMSFESSKFQSGITSTLTSLDKLNAALKKAGTDNGLDQIEKSASKISFLGLGNAIDKLKGKFGRGFPEADQAFSEVEKGSGKVTFGPLTSAIDKMKGQFGHLNVAADEAFSGVERSSGKISFSGLGQALDGLGNKFGVLEGIASVALGNIASRAAFAAGNMVKSFTLGPVIDGFHEYETQLNAVQTILANTQASGATLSDVSAALNDLNHYADQTIYNFTEMTKNIGTFTAAGVDLKTATGSIKGIANLAALSGSNSQQASTAMYQLSQAISSGRVSLQDWNSVVNAGMGGTVFQRALAQTAVKMGTLSDGAVTLKGKMKNVNIEGKSFRESIQAGPGKNSWLTSDVLTKTLQHFTGDLSNAQLAAEGFNASEIKAIQAQAKVAVEAATKVKTLSQLLDTTKEAIGSGWAQTWQIVFGDFNEAKGLFTGISNAINSFVGKSSKARNKLLQDWKDLGGRDALFAGLKNAVMALGSVLKPIKDAFRDIFPPATGKSLYDLTVRFRDFMASLKIGSGTADSLRSTFRGLFAVLDIGKQIVGGVFTAIGHMLGAVGDGSGGVLKLTGSIGDLLVSFDQWLKDGDKLKNVFAGLGDVLAVPLHLISSLAGKLGGLFSGSKVGGGAASAISGLGTALGPVAKAADAARSAWAGFVSIIQKVAGFLGPVAKSIADAFSNVASAVADALANNNWDQVFNVIQTGLVAGIFLTIKKALGGGLNIDLGGGVLKNVSGSLDTLRGSLLSLQKNIQAHTLLLIASAVGVLAASVVALSLVNPGKLSTALTAITVSMAELIGALSVLTKIAGAGGIVRIPIMAASLILLAAAVDVLVIAVLALSRLSWGGLAKGLAGVAALLLIVSAATIPLSQAGPGMIAAGIGLIGIAAALNILAGAVAIFATMSWESLGKGMASIAAALVIIAGAMQLMPATLPITGAGLILVGIGITALSGAIKILGSQDLGTLAKGIGAIAASLLVIAGAMQLMPVTLPITAAGLILVAIGLNGVAAAIALMGNMSIGTLAKGIGAMAASLVVLAFGLTAMIAALPGAAALLVAAAALAILVPVIGLLGTMKWGTIAKGLAVIAIALGVISIAGVVAAPALVALGVGLALFGAGLAVVTGAIYILAKGIALLAAVGPKGIAAFALALTSLIALLPKVIVSFLQGLVQVIAGIAKLAPLVVNSLITIVSALLVGITKIAPQFAQAATALITAFLAILVQNAPVIIQAGLTLFQALLTGIVSHISQITSTVVTIIVRILNTLSSNMPRITAAGGNLLVRFLQGVANNIGRVVTAVGTIITRFIGSISSNLGRIVTAGGNLVVRLVAGISNQLGRIVTAATTAVIKFAAGITNNIGRVVTAGTTLAIRLVNSIVDNLLRLTNAGAQAVIKFLNGVAAAIDRYEPQLLAAGANIGRAIVQGMINGVGSLAGALAAKIASLASSVPSGLLHKLGIKSPSRVTHAIGGYIVQGLANGISDSTPLAYSASTNLADNVIMAFAAKAGSSNSSAIGKALGQTFGKTISGSFHDALLGTKDDINQAFSDLQGKMSQNISNLDSKISQQRDRLKQLQSQKKPDKEAIRQLKDAIALNKELLDTTVSARHELVVGLKDEKSELVGLAKDFQKVSEQLDAANQVLTDAKKTRDDFATSTAQQFGKLPDLNTDAPDQLVAFTQALGGQAAATEQYRKTLEALRKLGLDDPLYQKLISDGTVDQAFADQILGGGPAAVQALNSLDAQLQTASAGLGTDTAKNLYQAGVNAAQGIVDGLESKKSDIYKAMESIATAMIKAIKKKLKIKSPSKEFALVGRYSSEGVAKGLLDSSGAITSAVSQIGDDALSTLQNSMSMLSGVIATEIDTDPTITPVLDLTQVRAGARQLNGLTNVTPITAAASYGLAAGVDTSAMGSDGASSDLASAKTLQFVQNNTSPKALSETEIYRQTNNQLSQAKKALGL